MFDLQRVALLGSRSSYDWVCSVEPCGIGSEGRKDGARLGPCGHLQLCSG